MGITQKPAARVSRKFLSLEGLTSSRREDMTEDGYCRAITEVCSDYPLYQRGTNTFPR